MKLRLFFIPMVFFLMFGMAINPVSSSEYNDNWPAWRGPLSTGEAVKGSPPTVWSETKNVKWKIPIPGKGLSSPVIWGDQIFLTSAVPLDKKAPAEVIEKMKAAQPGRKPPEYLQQFVVYSIDRNTGKIIWQKVVREQLPHESTHKDGSWASQSCVTDGEYIIASFGSYGIYCFDLKGNLLWEKDLGDMDAAFGEGSSPVLYKKYLIINRDQKKDSSIFVLDKTNGEVIWKKKRDEKTSWTTPIVVPVKGKPQIIVAGAGKSLGYDPANGDVIWEISGLSYDVATSPVAGGEMVYLVNSSREIRAIRLDEAKGDLKGSPALVWTHTKNGPYISSPLLYNNRLYYLRDMAKRLSCVEAKTGKRYYESIKLDSKEKVMASPVGVNGFIYVVGRNGMTHVLEDGVEFTMVSQNQLDDCFDASPAIAGNALYLRGLKSLYCISEHAEEGR